MDKLTDYQQYRQATADAKAKGWKVSNCFFLPAAVKEKISAGVLYTMALPEGLLLLEDGGGFYRVYYYLAPEALPAPVALDRPAVAEFPFRDSLTPAQLQQVQQLNALGFTLGRESSMMSVPSEALTAMDIDCSTVVSAQRSDLPQVQAMLEASFDPLYAFLPDEKALSAAIGEGRVLVIRREGRVVGVLNSSVEKKRACIDHVAVADSCRGQRLGRVLVEAYHRKYRGQVTEFQHWVDIHNLPAVRLYLAFGYQFHIRKANEYIRIP